MRVILQTMFSPIMTVYDSEAPDREPSSFSLGTLLFRILRPVIQLQDNRGRAITKTGEFYTSAFPLFVTLALFILGYLIIRRFAK